MAKESLAELMRTSRRVLGLDQHNSSQLAASMRQAVETNWRLKFKHPDGKTQLDVIKDTILRLLAAEDITVRTICTLASLQLESIEQGLMAEALDDPQTFFQSKPSEDC